MLTDQLTIPKGSRVLVTGANSYIGSNIIDLLLELGYNVRGTVRAEKLWLNAFFEKKYGKGRFESVTVPTLEDEGAFDEVLNDVAGVIHVASVVSLSHDPELVITPVVAATKNALQAASRHSSIKRFVLTSSSTSSYTPSINNKEVITEDVWNDSAVAAAWNKDTPAEKKSMAVYSASKTEGERAAWKWVKENQPGFTFNAVLPNLNLGRILTPEIAGSTMGWTRGLLEGDDSVTKLLPPQWYVDVQDTARLHVIALLAPAVHDERIFAFASPYNWTDVLAILQKLRPQKKLPKAPDNEGRDLSDVVPSKRAEALLKEYFGRPGWTSLEDSLAEGIADIV